MAAWSTTSSSRRPRSRGRAAATPRCRWRAERCTRTSRFPSWPCSGRRWPSRRSSRCACRSCASARCGSGRTAEPRASVWEVDFAQAAAFGGAADGGSGLSGPAPGAGEAVINADLAKALGARDGDVLTFYLYGRPTAVRVARVVPTKGVAGPGAPAAEPHTFSFVSNTGGVESGDKRSDAVAAKLKTVLGPLASQGTSV